MARTPVPQPRSMIRTPASHAVELTPDIIARIAANMRGGMLAIDAAVFEGVPEPTFGRWLRARGPIYDQLRVELARADATVNARLSLATLSAAAPMRDGAKSRPDLALALLRYRKKFTVQRSGYRGVLTRGGNPTTWSQKKQNLICKYIADGNFFSTACRRAGVSPDTAAGWMQEGRIEALKPEGEADLDFIPLRFFVAVTLAREAAEVDAVETIADARRDGDWKAAAWWLTHGPVKERWSGQMQQKVTGDVHVSGSITLQQQMTERVAALPADVVQREQTRIDSLLDMIENSDGTFEVKS